MADLVGFMGTELRWHYKLAEKDLQAYFVDHIEDFTRDVLEDELIDYKTEYALTQQIRFAPRSKRADLFIRGKRGEYIVELKTSKSTSEHKRALGQLLDYGREVEGSKMILLCTNFDSDTAKTIDHYNLPIKYIAFDGDHFFEYEGQLT